MGRTPLERISQREYAKRLGISNNAVSKAVADGRIKKGWDVKQGKIIVELANKEFGALHANVSVPVGEPVNEIEEEDVTQSKPSRSEFKLTTNSSYMDAKKVREIFLARQAEVDFKKAIGELVDIAIVEKELYDFGRDVRINLMAIPDKISGKLQACKNQAEIKLVIASALHEVLETLTERELNFQINN